MSYHFSGSTPVVKKLIPSRKPKEAKNQNGSSTHLFGAAANGGAQSRPYQYDDIEQNGIYHQPVDYKNEDENSDVKENRENEDKVYSYSEPVEERNGNVYSYSEPVDEESPRHYNDHVEDRNSERNSDRHSDRNSDSQASDNRRYSNQETTIKKKTGEKGVTWLAQAELEDSD